MPSPAYAQEAIDRLCEIGCIAPRRLHGKAPVHRNTMEEEMVRLHNMTERVKTEIRAVLACTSICSDRLPALIVPAETRQ
jgi:hypothetical protein